jgi:hypothetical protein
MVYLFQYIKDSVQKLKQSVYSNFVTQAGEAMRDIWLEKTFVGRKPRAGEPAAYFSREVERPDMFRTVTHALDGFSLASLPVMLTALTRLAITRMCSLVGYLIAQLPGQYYKLEDAMEVVQGMLHLMIMCRAYCHSLYTLS